MLNGAHENHVSSYRFSVPGRWRLLARGLLVLAARAPRGVLDLSLPDGCRHRAASRYPGPTAVVNVRRWRAFRRLFAGGDTGLLASYMDGDWDTPDLDAVLLWGAQNETAFRGVLNGSLIVRAFARLAHMGRANSRRGSQRNIAAHYDLGNDFYRLWLDSGMTYSAAVFSEPGISLEAAQQEKFDRLLAMLAVNADHHLLEIGCGWGGFALYAARRTGCRVTGITLSREQLNEARRRASEAGVADRVRFELRDYRDLSGRYDRIASIEMLEAVGEAYWPVYFRTLRERLTSDGRAALQVITIGDEFFDAYRKGADFIQRYIFPGGMLPSPGALARQAAGAGLLQGERRFYGRDYAQTLACWAERFRAQSGALQALGYDRRFQRMWLAYFAYCRAGFLQGRIDVMHTVMHRGD